MIPALGGIANPLRLIPLITQTIHDRDERLFVLLTKPGRLTASEWAYLEEAERRTD